jgi:hypothetical protein
VDLIGQSAVAIQGVGGFFEEPGDFPTPDDIDFPLHPEAPRPSVHGPPLQRSLAFRMATLIDRFKVILIPLIEVLISAFRLFSPCDHGCLRSRS